MPEYAPTIGPLACSTGVFSTLNPNERFTGNARRDLIRANVERDRRRRGRLFPVCHIRSCVHLRERKIHSIVRLTRSLTHVTVRMMN